MPSTIVIQCSRSKEFASYGFAVGQNNSLGRQGILYQQDWCPIHHDDHPAQSVVVEIPFGGDDYKNADGIFDVNWGDRFDDRVRKKAIPLFSSDLPSREENLTYGIGHKL